MRQDVLGCGLSLDRMSSYGVGRELIGLPEKARIIILNISYMSC